MPKKEPEPTIMQKAGKASSGPTTTLAALGLGGVSAAAVGWMLLSGNNAEIQNNTLQEDQARDIASLPSLQTTVQNNTDTIAANDEDGEKDLDKVKEDLEQDTKESFGTERDISKEKDELVTEFERIISTIDRETAKDRDQDIVDYENRIIDIVLDQQTRYDDLQDVVISQNHSLLLLILEGKMESANVVQEEFYADLNDQ